MNKKLLFEIKNELKENAPFFSEAKDLLEKLSKKNVDSGIWENAFNFLSSIRNRNLILDFEQGILRKTVVAFFGLSVGSYAVTAWMMISRAKTIKISDPDILSLSNLNRLKYGMNDVGKAKAKLMYKDLKMINPYCEIKVYTSKSENVVKKIIYDNPKPDIVIDEMDDLGSKILVRRFAKERKIPVIMATDVGDNVFLEVERYDISDSTELFNGRAGNLNDLDLTTLSPGDKMKIMFSIVGLEDNSERMLRSLKSIGRKIKTWPQLGSTAMISGGLVASTIKKIVLKEKINSGRYKLQLDSLLEVDYNSQDRVIERNKLIQSILQA